MTPELLLDAIYTFLLSVLQEYKMTSSHQTLVTPRVYKWDTPPKQSDDGEYPFVVVRILSGKDTEDASTVRVKMLFGAYAEDSQGSSDTSNLMEHIRQALFKKRTLDDRFRVEYPYEWQIFEEQPDPYWVGESISTWNIQGVEEEVKFDD